MEIVTGRIAYSMRKQTNERSNLKGKFSVIERNLSDWKEAGVVKEKSRWLDQTVEQVIPFPVGDFQGRSLWRGCSEF